MYQVINLYIKKDDYYELYIKNTKDEEAICLIDNEDYETISLYRWTIKKDEQGNFRVRCTSSEYRGKDLHLLLFSYDTKQFVVDHINRNPLDNRKKNLRITTHSINSTNAKARSNSKTNIRGVYYRPERKGISKPSWICEWSINGKRHTKTFSCNKYGFDKAFQMAKEYRENKLKEMKI